MLPSAHVLVHPLRESSERGRNATRDDTDPLWLHAMAERANTSTGGIHLLSVAPSVCVAAETPSSGEPAGDARIR